MHEFWLSFVIGGCILAFLWIVTVIRQNSGEAAPPEGAQVRLAWGPHDE